MGHSRESSSCTWPCQSTPLLTLAYQASEPMPCLVYFSLLNISMWDEYHSSPHREDLDASRINYTTWLILIVTCSLTSITWTREEWKEVQIWVSWLNIRHCFSPPQSSVHCLTHILPQKWKGHSLNLDLALSRSCKLIQNEDVNEFFSAKNLGRLSNSPNTAAH